MAGKTDTKKKKEKSKKISVVVVVVGQIIGLFRRRRLPKKKNGVCFWNFREKIIINYHLRFNFIFTFCPPSRRGASSYKRARLLLFLLRLRLLRLLRVHGGVGNFRVFLFVFFSRGRERRKNNVLEEEDDDEDEFFGRGPRRDDGTKNEEEREEKNLLRVSRDERTARRVRGEIRSGGREMQEISGSTFGVLKEGRVRRIEIEKL